MASKTDEELHDNVIEDPVKRYKPRYSKNGESITTDHVAWFQNRTAVEGA